MKYAQGQGLSIFVSLRLTKLDNEKKLLFPPFINSFLGSTSGIFSFRKFFYKIWSKNNSGHMKNYCFIGLILISVAPSVLADDLKIGSLILSTGMEQADIMEDLRSHFHIVRVPGAKSMFFVSQDKADRARPIASLAFENGRVSWIERNWGTFSGRISPVEVTKALLSAMESAKASSGSSVVINTSVKNSHGAEFKSVHFVFPDRKVIVVTTNGDTKRGHHVRIYERVYNNDAQHYDDQLSPALPCNPICPDMETLSLDPLVEHSQTDNRQNGGY